MTVRIEAGEIVQDKAELWRRLLLVKDVSTGDIIINRTIYADTKEELEIVDHENFMKE